MTDTVRRLGRMGVVPVVTLDRGDQGEPLARALALAGLPCAEITLRNKCGLKALEGAAAVKGFLAGAGTVLNGLQAIQAIHVGAQFLVSPGLSREVLDVGRAAGVPVIPGTATPTEVMRALELGIQLVKFFPAASSGGPSALRALASVFPQLHFMPTGGITKDNMSDYLDVPAVLAVGGTWIAPQHLLAQNRLEDISALARDAVATIASLRSAQTDSRTDP